MDVLFVENIKQIEEQYDLAYYYIIEFSAVSAAGNDRVIVKLLELYTNIGKVVATSGGFCLFYNIIQCK